jgi:hypothetical protein
VALPGETSWFCGNPVQEFIGRWDLRIVPMARILSCCVCILDSRCLILVGLYVVTLSWVGFRLGFSRGISGSLHLGGFVFFALRGLRRLCVFFSLNAKFLGGIHPSTMETLNVILVPTPGCPMPRDNIIRPVVWPATETLGQQTAFAFAPNLSIILSPIPGQISSQ